MVRKHRLAEARRLPDGAREDLDVPSPVAEDEDLPESAGSEFVQVRHDMQRRLPGELLDADRSRAGDGDDLRLPEVARREPGRIVDRRADREALGDHAGRLLQAVQKDAEMVAPRRVVEQMDLVHHHEAKLGELRGPPREQGVQRLRRRDDDFRKPAVARAVLVFAGVAPERDQDVLEARLQAAKEIVRERPRRRQDQHRGTAPARRERDFRRRRREGLRLSGGGRCRDEDVRSGEDPGDRAELHLAGLREAPEERPEGPGQEIGELVHHRGGGRSRSTSQSATVARTRLRVDVSPPRRIWRSSFARVWIALSSGVNPG